MKYDDSSRIREESEMSISSKEVQRTQNLGMRMDETKRSVSPPPRYFGMWIIVKITEDQQSPPWADIIGPFENEKAARYYKKHLNRKNGVFKYRTSLMMPPKW